MSSKNRHGFPSGTELVFGDQASQQREVAALVAKVMHGWGFTELILPSFDHSETFAGSTVEQDLYRFTDQEGQQLTLRGDFTRLAAKALAPLLNGNASQIRATYEGRVFRFRPSGHGDRVEHFQRGLEWINASGIVFDAAVLMIVREILKSTGLDGARVVIGHAGFVRSILGDSGQNNARLLEAIDHKNPSRILDLAKRIGMSTEKANLLAKLPMLTGDASVLLAAKELALPEGARDALAELNGIHKLLSDVGQQDHIMFDLGEVRRFNYYSGFMFKLYHKAVGTEFGGGGRYDSLFKEYGHNVPAVGFALDIGQITKALGKQPDSVGATAISGTNIETLKAAAKARSNGEVIDFGSAR